MYKPGGTLKEALASIEQKKWVLPAIQREFVWKPQQITDLFDSLMREFPFGTFLFWQVDAERSGEWKFYDFVRDYHERDARHCPELGPITNRAVTAVLDGQQRLTALNIGLRGSIALKRKHARATSFNAYPQWHLYLNLLSRAQHEDSAEGQFERHRYEFRFLEVPRPPVEGEELWFRVSEILSMTGGPAMVAWLTSQGLTGESLNVAYAALDQLFRVIHTNQLVYSYDDASPDLERVLSIFIRLNSAGTMLSQSDLLHSIIVSQWSKLDARKEIANLVDEMNRIGPGFAFTQNFVLKAGLMLADVASVGFRLENFTRSNMALLEDNWPAVKAAMVLTTHLAAQFGLGAKNLRADSSLLPIAYYLYRRGAPENYLTHSQFAPDRDLVRRWLIASLLKPSGIWGSGLDTLLTALRTAIKEDGEEAFPDKRLREVMAGRGKTLTFDEAEIEGLLSSEYGRPGTFLALSLLYPFVDLRNQYHVDHIYPSALTSKAAMRRAEVSEESINWIFGRRNRLANLQLLNGAENIEKQKALPREWLMSRFPSDADRIHYTEIHDIGPAINNGIEGFRPFCTERRERMRARLQHVLND
jgi:hypothetical protein